MVDSKLTSKLPRLVEQVSMSGQTQASTMTINDLLLGIREIRLTEISDWSRQDLDSIELHAARFDGEAPLTDVLGQPTREDAAELAVAGSSICSPSPFAWM